MTGTIKPVTEDCMFCGQTPCECPGSAKPKNAKKAVPAKIKRSSIRKVETVSGPELDELLGKEPKPKFKEKKKAERDFNFESALRVIREIVKPSDQEWIDKQLNPVLPQSVDRRVIDWRARHENQS